MHGTIYLSFGMVVRPVGVQRLPGGPRTALQHTGTR